MTPDNKTDIASDPEFLLLEKTQARLSFGYAAVALGAFTVFVTTMICWPEMLAQNPFGDSEVSLALVGTLMLIVLPLLISGLYLRTVERKLDPLRERLIAKRSHGRHDR